MMDTNMFASMLFGKDPAEAYFESPEGKEKIYTTSSLGAVMQILIDKKIVTEDEFKAYRDKIEEVMKNKIREEIKNI